MERVREARARPAPTLARHWRLAAWGALTATLLTSLFAGGAYAPAVVLLVAVALSWPCLAGRAVWPALVPGRLTQLTQRCWDEWQRRDWDSMAVRMAPDIVMEDVAEGETYRGPAAVRARLERFVEAFPDGRIEVLGIDESADRTTSQLAFRGTNTGPYAGHPPTGRLVEGRFCEVFTFRRGQIVLVEEYYDRGAIFRQLGLEGATPPETAGSKPNGTRENRATKQAQPEPSRKSSRRVRASRRVPDAVRSWSADWKRGAPS